MGRLSLSLLFIIFFVSSDAFATTEKENEQRDLRLLTLQKELQKEKNALQIQTEELTFYIASGGLSTERINELKESILATEDNIKFLNAEIQNAMGEKPQARRGIEENTPQKKIRMWWDVYSREKTIQ